jgi:hypothetical protein
VVQGEPLGFGRFTRGRHFVDVFRAGRDPVRWTAKSDQDWIRLSRGAGESDERVWIEIDWSRAPEGEDVRGLVRVAAAGQEIPVHVRVDNPRSIVPPREAEFVEDGRRIVMEAEHASARLGGKDAAWTTVDGLGYNGAAVLVSPVTVPVRSDPARIQAESPCLQYRVFVRHPGEWKVTLRALPTWSVEAGQPQRYATAFDDALPQIVPIGVYTDEHNRRWQEDVLRNAALSTSVHSLDRPGLHTLNVWMVDPGIVIDTIFADGGSGQELGYLGPDETRVVRP